MNNSVLVTGADGFIGSHLVETLVRDGYKVKAFCLYNSLGSWGWLDHSSPEIIQNVEIILGDVRDQFCVENSLVGVDIVFHLASLIAIPHSYKAPQSYVETNINGTLNILQSSKKLGIEKIIHTSTSETYGTAQYVPIDEKHPLIAQSPYAATKIAADQLAMSFFKSFNTPVTILRPFNTYGPRQSARAVIPTIISQLASGKNKVSLGKLSPTRDFNYVQDTVNAFKEVAFAENTIGKIINCASNFEISIEDTVYLIADIMNKKIEISSESERKRPEKSEVNRLFGDNKLIKEITNWYPKYSGKKGFREGLKLTIDWFSKKENLSFYRPDIYSV